jgi:hypothetical protein
VPKQEGTKADFVRALPESMPAKEIVEKAKDAGLKLSTAYVYVIRSQARTGTKKKPKSESSSGSPRASAGAEARLIAAAGELGLTRSIDLLTREKTRLMKMLR